MAECLTPLFSIDNPIADADFIGLELQLRELVIDPWLDDLLEARFASIEPRSIPEAREIGRCRLDVDIRRQQAGSDGLVLQRIKKRLAPRLRRHRHCVVFADITTAHRLADCSSKLFRRHVKARLFASLGIGSTHVFQGFGERAPVPKLDGAFDGEIAFAAHIFFEVVTSLCRAGHYLTMHR
ncbi:MAG: hypothetical protein EOS04_20700 [Mesorhizobium sp.]|nr:MAG: hypothetical protein EOS04_20700 [Mesorhizobium sp.]